MHVHFLKIYPWMPRENRLVKMGTLPIWNSFWQFCRKSCHKASVDGYNTFMLTILDLSEPKYDF